MENKLVALKWKNFRKTSYESRQYLTVSRDSNQSNELRESHNWSQSGEQIEICRRSQLNFYRELCRIDQVGVPGKEDDFQRHDDAQWSNDEQEKIGSAVEPAVVLAISWPEFHFEAGELDDESWYHDKNWHDPAEHGVHTEAFPCRT